MKSNDTATSAHERNGFRPSLYVNDVASAQAKNNASILGKLEPHRALKRQALTTLLLSVSIGVVVAALYYANLSHVNVVKWPTTAWLKASTEKTAKPAAASQEQPAAQATIEHKAIEDEPHSPAVLVEISTDAQAHDVQGAAAVSAENAKQDERVAVSETAVNGTNDSGLPLRVESEVASFAASSHPTRSEKLASANADAAPMHKQEKGKKSAAEKKPVKDRDVELIAALLSGSSSSREPLQRSMQKPKVRSPGVKQDPQTDTKRDVVVRTGTEPTEALVKRCQTLGLIEGELCRFRICSGRWGNDRGCPAVAQAPAVN